jgi:transcriptional regulator with XRE-family HTH domain
MTSVGELLRQERENQGRAIAEVAEELCITQRYVRAIEEDDIGSLPGVFFYKSFVRQYAAILQMDEKLLQPGVQTLTEPPEPVTTPDIRTLDPLVEATNRRFVPDLPMGWSVATLLGVLLVCSGFYAWWNRLPEAIPVAVSTPPSAPVIAVRAQAATPETEEVTGVVLKLSATERTWLRITSEGQEVFSGILQPSESKTLTGLEKATMKVGNAGGIDVRWNGKSIGPLGTRGQVLTIQFTPEDFEILPPKQDL